MSLLHPPNGVGTHMPSNLMHRLLSNGSAPLAYCLHAEMHWTGGAGGEEGGEGGDGGKGGGGEGGGGEGVEGGVSAAVQSR